MKHLVYKTSLAIIVLTLAVYIGGKMYEVNNEVDSDLLAKNIEALADDSETSQKCTKPTIYGSCYDEQGNWCGTWIDEVEEYTVEPGSPIRCYHFYKHDCPSGSKRIK